MANPTPTRPAWQPAVSVIMPVYNAAAYLRAAIDSVLGQSHPPSELILVDDGSTDASAAIIASLPPPPTGKLILLRQANQGPAHARNQGIAQATGELLAFLDADDLWLPEKLALQLALLAEQPGLEGAICQMACFVEPGGAWPKGRSQAHFEPAMAATNFGTLLLRRPALERVGPLDPSLRHGEDTDWVFRAREMGLRLGVVPQPLLRRRFHAHNLSHRDTATPEHLLAITRAALRRRLHERR